LETKLRRQNRDERIIEATEQWYAGPSFEHPSREPSEDASPGVPSETRSQTPMSAAQAGREESTPRILNRCAPVTDPTPGTEGVATPPNTSQGVPQLRRSIRSTPGKLQTGRYADVFLARVEDFADESMYSHLAYMAKLQTDWEKSTINISDPRVYAAKI
jgi:hypothetical protein